MAVPYYWIGRAALLALAGLFVWQAPGRNGPAAAALTAALVLDAVSRLTADAVSRRSGVDVAIRVQPSLILSLAAAPLLPAACLAALPLVGPDRFPVVASLIAGLMAMGALARLALARSVTVLARADDAE